MFRPVTHEIHVYNKSFGSLTCVEEVYVID